MTRFSIRAQLFDGVLFDVCARHLRALRRDVDSAYAATSRVFVSRRASSRAPPENVVKDASRMMLYFIRFGQFRYFFFLMPVFKTFQPSLPALLFSLALRLREAGRDLPYDARATTPPCRDG